MSKKPKKDQDREERIFDEILVDAYEEEEKMMSWYYYLEEKLQDYLTARCISYRAISLLRIGDEVEILGMAPLEECKHEMFVMIRWDKKEGLGVPLSQLRMGDGSEEAKEAVKDWHYWTEQGYQL